MKKTLVLYTQDGKNFFPDYSEYCYLMPLYKKGNYIHRVYRKIIFRFRLPLYNILFSHWLSIISKVDTIIIFDTGNAPFIINWLRKKYPQKRIILWFWNSIKDTIKPNLIDSSNIEMWSFDKSDCYNYGLKYNIQFFIDENLKCLNNNVETNEVDVFYVGVDKNRAKLLYELKKIFDNNNISYNFNLVKYRNSTNDFNIDYKAPLKYLEVLEYIHKSKAIVDLVAEWQTGLTLRPLEALFLKKKLITNMKDIREYDLYNKNNIFIIGIDDNDTLVDFINSEFDETNRENLMKNYSFKEWLLNFNKK